MPAARPEPRRAPPLPGDWGWLPAATASKRGAAAGPTPPWAWLKVCSHIMRRRGRRHGPGSAWRRAALRRGRPRLPPCSCALNDMLLLTTCAFTDIRLRGRNLHGRGVGEGRSESSRPSPLADTFELPVRNRRLGGKQDARRPPAARSRPPRGTDSLPSKIKPAFAGPPAGSSRMGPSPRLTRSHRDRHSRRQGERHSRRQGGGRSRNSRERDRPQICAHDA